MKKIIILVSLVAVILVIGTAAAFAGDGFHGRNFTDANSDGVCDNYVTGQCGTGFIDADSDGVCDNYASGQCGNGYTDQDGDGICDNRGYYGGGAGHHGGNHSHGAGHGYCVQ